MFIDFLMNLLFPNPKAENCWCCGKETPFISYPEGIHASPLGGPFSWQGCPDCMTHRAVNVTHAAWWLCSIDESVPKDEALLDQFLNRFDADGTKYGRPVHVMQHGTYSLIREWLRSPERALACSNQMHHPRMF